MVTEGNACGAIPEGFRKLSGIATPVCALVRNDVFFFCCAIGNAEDGVPYGRSYFSIGYTRPQSFLRASMRSMTAMDSERGMEVDSISPERIRDMASRIWYS